MVRLVLTPMSLEMDNSTAEVFAKNSSWKSRLKHIDNALEWVRCLRDPGILVATHVPTKDNLALMIHSGRQTKYFNLAVQLSLIHI